MPAVYPFRALSVPSPGRGMSRPCWWPRRTTCWTRRGKAEIAGPRPGEHRRRSTCPCVPGQGASARRRRTRGGGEILRGSWRTSGVLGQRDLRPRCSPTGRPLRVPRQGPSSGAAWRARSTRSPFGPREGGGHPAPRADLQRSEGGPFALMKATGAQLSPIFGLHADESGTARGLKTASARPDGRRGRRHDRGHHQRRPGRAARGVDDLRRLATIAAYQGRAGGRGHLHGRRSPPVQHGG
jgi:hypothetical protein